ncbi:MAG: TonB-dependent receptor [Paludibacteraceae bacterium]|nr:TonB-dependent receptor [Paludibacteraceae bacterium]
MKENDKSAHKVSITLLTLFLGLFLPIALQAQDNIKIYGTVYEEYGGGLLPLDFATVSFPDYDIGVTSSNGGSYILNNAPTGKVKIKVQYLGKHEIDTAIYADRDIQLDFILKNEDFLLQEVMVTAKVNDEGQSTSSVISRQAMDHLQATSLYDLMSLLPGGKAVNPSLSSSHSIEIRQTGAYNSAQNALGVSIIRDGAPMSNNANLSTLNPVTYLGSVSGSLNVLGGGASPSGGVDVRSISTENIESVEIIRGIPSVEYGDLTSGAVIIHSKAGREPLRIKAKANPNVYQGSIGKGIGLGKSSGALNLSLDYAYNVNDVMQSYLHYQRLTAKALYSNVFFNNGLRSNTSLDIYYGKDQRDKNPADEITMVKSQGNDLGFTLNTNGRINVDKGWLENIKYVISGSITNKESFHEEATSSGNAPYSGVMTDGTVLSNNPGKHLYASDSTEITNFSASDAGYYAYYLPNSYIEHNSIDSKEINVFAKITANFFKRFGKVNNRILLGSDFKTDGNEGDGKTFGQNTPPLRPVSFLNGSFRPRSYKDIPWVTQFGLFAEEKLNWMLGKRDLDLQAGLRYDICSVVGGTLSPRLNASFEVIPEKLSIRGGYGVTAKMPTLIYLYPEDAYFEYTAINELMNEDMPQEERKFVTTTRVFDTQNKDLKVEKKNKAEVGFDLALGKVKLSVTAFQEHLKNGYSLSTSIDGFRLVPYQKLSRNENDPATFDVTNYQVLSYFNTPGNSRFSKTKGVEFEVNIGRFEAIRTSFQLNGAWMHSDAYFDQYDICENNSEDPSTRHDVGIYGKHNYEHHDENLTTALRVIHNIPKLGFVVSLTAQATWQEMDWTTYNNDSIPVGYISMSDGKPHYFDTGLYNSVQQMKDAGLSYLLLTPNHSDAIKESYKPYFCFNLNLTKEISDKLRVSFFANNVFRSYPRRESKRYPGEFSVMNNRFYFGMELSLKI